MLRSKTKTVAGLLAAALTVPVSIALIGCGSGPERPPAPSGGTVTFNRDVAPILFENCAVCHRPGESAPFSLLTYSDAKKHVKQIVEVYGSRDLPPSRFLMP